MQKKSVDKNRSQKPIVKPKILLMVEKEPELLKNESSYRKILLLDTQKDGAMLKNTELKIG